MITDSDFATAMGHIREIEHNLRRVMSQIGMFWEQPAGPPMDDDVRQMIMSGNKIAAIKVLRDRYDMTLTDAKNVVDGYPSM